MNNKYKWVIKGFPKRSFFVFKSKHGHMEIKKSSGKDRQTRGTKWRLLIQHRLTAHFNCQSNNNNIKSKITSKLKILVYQLRLGIMQNSTCEIRPYTYDFDQIFNLLPTWRTNDWTKWLPSITWRSDDHDFIFPLSKILYVNSLRERVEMFGCDILCSEISLSKSHMPSF